MILILDRILKPLTVLLAVAVILGACNSDRAATGRPVIVVTTSMLGDVVANVAGNDAGVEVLIPIGGDPHEYQPSARDTAVLASAALVVANGLGLEGGFGDVLDSIARDGTPVLTLGPQLDPLPLRSAGGEARSAGTVDDPHVWMDPIRMAGAAKLVAARLESLLPGRDWSSRADAYARTLITTDAEIRSTLASIPADARRLVTNHDSLEYFADRYDMTVVGTVIPGGSTMAQPGSADLARLLDVMRRENTRVVFAETIEPRTLADSLAAEVGPDALVVELFTGSLGGPGSGAETLIEMLLTDARRIAGALGQ